MRFVCKFNVIKISVGNQKKEIMKKCVDSSKLSPTNRSIDNFINPWIKLKGIKKLIAKPQNPKFPIGIISVPNVPICFCLVPNPEKIESQIS